MGTNELVLEDAGSALVLPPDGTTGVQFSGYLHSAFDRVAPSA